ncbi:PREDICTED: uncharacterized protein C19orf47 homolog [Polistes dominula]|uniref:Uncharacterized protein C19orf47 homolog n=1 Tax=Polistes dominula TaxID=743375 RepID=A0ABM1JG31_POLDO|nr:PREDICTED: uncharacterized protein C19orf47 homolog [Polistes dominula]
MAISLSAYWVKFFKGAGFPQDVATKHAVVFSNNRIKPDMLPDLDKPSLKEMGITLMGDMIAIIRYAKKVVEETTCEKFLVDTEDPDTPAKLVNKPIIKKAVTKVTAKSPVVIKTKSSTVTNPKTVKNTSTVIPKITTVKKSSVVLPESKKPTNSLKRTLCVEPEEGYNESYSNDWSVVAKKKPKPQTNNDEDNDKVGYTVIIPKMAALRNLPAKKAVEQKRTVFDRLGDSSVTSTTNLPETSPTFNVTGLGKNTYKRTISVFNRLGDKDSNKSDTPQLGILKNGTTKTTTSQGILKNSSSNVGISSVAKKKIIAAGTMHADHEVNNKTPSNSVKRLVRTTKKITFNENGSNLNKTRNFEVTSGKLASERLATIPAKARLGVLRSSSAKQVTFNRVATVTHVKKPDVFSRLGI